MSLFFRGTKDFAVRGSHDGEKWEHLLGGRLQDPADNDACNKPLLINSIDSRNFRYLEFTAVSFYGDGPALQFFGTAERKKIKVSLLILSQAWLGITLI